MEGLMSRKIPGNTVSETELPEPQRLLWHLVVLWKAWHCAQSTGTDPWQHAVELEELQSENCTRVELRWLIQQGYLSHAVERLQLGSNERQFDPIRNLSVPQGTCFVLTPAGVEWLRGQMGGRCRESVATPETGGEAGPRAAPVWDRARRQLRWGTGVIKQLRHLARDQEEILEAFEQQHWPQRISNPLPRRPHSNSKQRLRNTVDNLNRNHRLRRIRFRTDGNLGVIWEAVPILSFKQQESTGQRQQAKR
jgi:hypothetical protein